MLLPRNIISFLEKNALYRRMRYRGFIYRLWLLIRRDVRKSYNAKQKLYQQLFPRTCTLIFDVGANEGMLTNIFRQLSKKVIAVEPANRNLDILKAKFYRYNNVVILPAAIGSQSGEQSWYEDETDYATGTLSSKWNELKGKEKGIKTTFIKTMTLDELIKQYGCPDYIKIDVEGYELPVLQGLSHQISLLSFEAILPHFLKETLQCIDYLSGINASITFNFCIDEKFVDENFTDKEELIKNISFITRTIDVFCKMK